MNSGFSSFLSLRSTTLNAVRENQQAFEPIAVQVYHSERVIMPAGKS